MNKEIIKHGKWSFDYNNKKSYYDYDEISIVNKYFKLSEETSETKVHEPKKEILLEDNESILQTYRKSALMHKLVRQETTPMLKNGAKYIDIVKAIEDSIMKFTRNDRHDYFTKMNNYTSGIAFPVGISVNNIIAHDTALPNDERTIKKGDIVKIDIGLHNDGYIIDSAYTAIIDEDNENHKYTPLLEATRDATFSAISGSGPDSRLYELSELIQEVIKSYEIDDKQILPVFGLGGHNIKRNELHSGKLVLSVPHKIQEGLKMEAGEVYAIETYATTGSGMPTQKGTISHFSFENKNADNKMFKKSLRTSKSGLENWLVNRNGLPFSLSWCEEAGISNYEKGLYTMVTNKMVTGYPPLADSQGSMSSQYEHTIYVGEKGVEILSLGKDY